VSSVCRAVQRSYSSLVLFELYCTFPFSGASRCCAVRCCAKLCNVSLRYCCAALYNISSGPPPYSALHCAVSHRLAQCRIGVYCGALRCAVLFDKVRSCECTAQFRTAQHSAVYCIVIIQYSTVNNSWVARDDNTSYSATLRFTESAARYSAVQCIAAKYNAVQ
jgi:hypothetical protein